jgi:hypothetical protein
MGLFRSSQVDKIVSAEQDHAATVASFGEGSGMARSSGRRVSGARFEGSVAENIQASHELVTGDSSGREAGPRVERGYRSLRTPPR